MEVAAEGPYFDLRVARVIDETHDARSIVLEVPDALGETFRYQAGQFLTFHIKLGDHPLVRSYSLASSPDTDKEHKVTVKRVIDGRVSNWFNDALAPGDVLQVMKPAGHFCLQSRGTPIVMFGGGSGITPIISIVKSVLATSERCIELLYANRDEDSIIFRDELDALSAAHPERLSVIHRLDVRDGFVDVSQARERVAATPEADFYICGPGEFMDVVEEAMRAEAVAQDRIFIERFVSPELEALDAPPPTDLGEVTTTVEVYLDGTTAEVPCHDDETLLAAAHRAGLDAPCACLEGYCGSCMAMLKQGEVEMRENDGGLSPKQVAQGWVLTCQSVARSRNVRIEYPDPD
jgi:3-ketosteroid 9alpha-monooxygenase subunit B